MQFSLSFYMVALRSSAHRCPAEMLDEPTFELVLVWALLLAMRPLSALAAALLAGVRDLCCTLLAHAFTTERLVFLVALHVAVTAHGKCLNDKCGHACSGCKLPTPSEHGYVVLRIVSRRALLQIYRMGCLRRLVLELNGRFDRAAMRGLLDRAAGVEASEVGVEFRTADS